MLLTIAFMNDRLDELEIRYTLQQDLIAQLNEVVTRHEQEIERLRALVDELRAPRDVEQPALDPDERPPHY